MLFVDDFMGVSELIDVVHNYCNCIYIFLVSKSAVMIFAR